MKAALKPLELPYQNDLISLALRFVFAATLLVFFFKSALTKFGDGISGLWSPSVGAYAQIFPVKFDAVGYDVAQMSQFDTLITLGGTWGELLLPIALILGFFTRLSAIGIIIFIIIMSYVDITGHGVTEGGALFDNNPNGIIYDNRLYWISNLFIIALLGGGRFSLDGLIAKVRK